LAISGVVVSVAEYPFTYPDGKPGAKRVLTLEDEKTNGGTIRSTVRLMGRDLDGAVFVEGERVALEVSVDAYISGKTGRAGAALVAWRRVPSASGTHTLAGVN
jgi:hypothetical protein